eukprot:CAMPEP_0113618114 /NCGR_PEP_ID=MMETSP0017_2-20120614/9160_1 /TAXON_ID=2856 /ORGANISM="Cylindrotheca closterium" /LENGTH=496 /DNA_ID=CAMNT_0000527593 /DNA_START=239 /DNA_END=1729 /DNA_ORIENTATION=+ /assembly_acc=CAM_ASM_000147
MTNQTTNTTTPNNNNNNMARAIILPSVARPRSILRSPKRWSSPQARRSRHRLRFNFGSIETRLYVPDGTTNRSSRGLCHRVHKRTNRTAAASRSHQEAGSPEPSSPPESSTNGPGNVEEPQPMQIDEPYLKRLASLDPSFVRPSSKRRKLDSLTIPDVRSIPCSKKEWCQRVNARWTPPNPNKRSPSSDLPPSSRRPTKRVKLEEETVPSTSTEWAQRINAKHTPPVPVIVSRLDGFDDALQAEEAAEPGNITMPTSSTSIIEDREEEDDESHIDLSLDGIEDALDAKSILCQPRKDWETPRTTKRVRFQQEPSIRTFFLEEDEKMEKKQHYRQIKREVKRAEKWKKAWKEHRQLLPTFLLEKADFQLVLAYARKHPRKLPTVLQELLSNIPSQMDLDEEEHVVEEALQAEEPGFSVEDVGNEEIAATPEQSQITTDTPSTDGLGSGWTKSGKRYSLRRANLLQAAEDASTEGLGSGITNEGRRFSRRLANRSDAN